MIKDVKMEKALPNKALAAILIFSCQCSARSNQLIYQGDVDIKQA